MQETLRFGISGLLICFFIATLILNRIKTDEYPEDYDFKLDPFWCISGIMFIGGIAAFALFPTYADTINSYSYFDVTVPVLFAVLIYFGYLFDVPYITNLLTFICALIVSYIQPDTFNLFPEHLTLWQSRLLVAILLFIISKGLGILNGIGGIASSQFITVMILVIILMYIGALPQILGVLAMIYAGTMLAFAFFSWPPEKLFMSDGAFSAFGFIMGYFMLNGAVEYAEVPMFIGASYLFAEAGAAFYRRIWDKSSIDRGFIYTTYFQISNDGKYDKAVAFGVIKILFVDIVLAVIQTASVERLAFPLFAIALNIWFLSILSGDTKPEELLSISKWGRKAVKGVLSAKKNNKSAAKKKSKRKSKQESGD